MVNTNEIANSWLISVAYHSALTSTEHVTNNIDFIKIS